MPEDPKAQDSTEATLRPQNSLAARARQYGIDVEQVVRGVGEHPQYELKRAYDLSSLQQRMELVKDIQSIATSRIDTEKFLVIGADEQTRKFVPVTNPQDFDDAKLRQQLARYLSPVPKFEVFRLRTSDDVPFILFVIGRQPTRRILAKATVNHPSEQQPKVLLREGDLWTKGDDSTGKYLARPTDWDAIYEEAIEREAESRTRNRTDHVVQQVIAQERIRAVSGRPFALPAYLSDEEFKAVVEEICAENNANRLGIILERLRDELIEGWHKFRAYDGSLIRDTPEAIPEFRESWREYKENVFRPAIQRLILLCLSIIKYHGSVSLFEQSIDLIRETFNASHRMQALRMSSAYGSNSKDIDDHLSHTTAALEALIAVYIIGAYSSRRRRFAYARLLLHQTVRAAGLEHEDEGKLAPMPMWPLRARWGAPEALNHRAGRIDICMGRLLADATVAGFFGTEQDARTSLIEFEFLVDLNSFLAVDSKPSPDTYAYMQTMYPTINFSFWPSLIAFDLRHIVEFAAEIFSDLQLADTDALSNLLFDSKEAQILVASGKDPYLKFLRYLQNDHGNLMLQLHRFGSYVCWPNELQEALKALPRE